MLDASQIFDGTFSPLVGAPITVTRVSTNTLDLLTSRDVGTGEILGMHLDITQSFAGGTSLQVALQVGATAGGTFYPIIQSPVYPVAQLVAGAPIFRYAIPPNEELNSIAGVLNAPGRFLQLAYTVVGTFTSGAVFAYITPREDRNVFRAPPSNYTVGITAGEI